MSCSRRYNIRRSSDGGAFLGLKGFLILLIKMMPLLGLNWIVLGLVISHCISGANSYMVDGEYGPRDGNTVSYTYDRLDQVKKECASVISSASVLKPDDNKVYSLKEELSFLNGDWWQNSKGSPIMPFDDRDVEKGFSDDDLRSPLSVVSFWVMIVDRGHR